MICFNLLRLLLPLVNVLGGWVGCVKLYSKWLLLYFQLLHTHPPVTPPLLHLIPFLFTLFLTFPLFFPSNNIHILLPQPHKRHLLHVDRLSHAFLNYIQQPLFLYIHSPSNHLPMPTVTCKGHWRRSRGLHPIIFWASEAKQQKQRTHRLDFIFIVWLSLDATIHCDVTHITNTYWERKHTPDAALHTYIYVLYCGILTRFSLWGVVPWAICIYYRRLTGPRKMLKIAFSTRRNWIMPKFT